MFARGLTSRRSARDVLTQAPKRGAAMDSAIDVLVRHGYALVFGWVFAEQIGLPIPAVPVLLASGALAGSGRLSLLGALAAAGVASLLSDTIWYWLGRVRGGSVLGWLCRVSLEPGLVCPPHPADVQRPRRARAPDLQVRARLQHRRAAAGGDHRHDLAAVPVASTRPGHCCGSRRSPCRATCSANDGSTEMAEGAWRAWTGCRGCWRAFVGGGWCCSCWASSSAVSCSCTACAWRASRPTELGSS